MVLCKQILWVGHRLEFQGVPAWILEEHCPLLTWLTCKASPQCSACSRFTATAARHFCVTYLHSSNPFYVFTLCAPCAITLSILALPFSGQDLCGCQASSSMRHDCDPGLTKLYELLCSIQSWRDWYDRGWQTPWANSAL